MAAGEKFRMLVADALARSGKGILAFEMAHGLKPSSIKAIVSPALRQTPSIDKAEMIAQALGLEFYIGPPRAAQDQDAPPPLPPRLRARLHLPDDATEADALAALDALPDSAHQWLSRRADRCAARGLGGAGPRGGPAGRRRRSAGPLTPAPINSCRA